MTPSGPEEVLPTIMAIDDDPESLDRLGELLNLRYGAEYRIVLHRSPWAALADLQALADRDARVPLVLADQWMSEMDGVELLGRIRSLFAETKRALLVEFGDRSVAEPVLSAMALGRIECHLVKPAKARDESFHRLVTDLLEEWGRDAAEDVPMRIIADRWDSEAHDLRDMLDRSGLPYAFHEADSAEGAALLADHGVDASSLPVVTLWDGSALTSPSRRELADRLTPRPRLGSEPLDVVVVGSGPAGLSAAVYAASEGLEVLVVEREAIGGQAGTSSLIRNFLGFPRGISGNDLAQRAYQQAWMFGAQFTLMREAVALEPKDDLKLVRLSDGTDLISRAVIVATGVSYRRLQVRSLEAFVGTGVFYGAGRSEARAMRGQDVYVVGGANSAGQAALNLSRFARRVTLLVRGEGLSRSMSDYLIRQIGATGNIRVLTRTEVVGAAGEGHLQELVLRNTQEGSEERVPAAALFVLIGAVPHTEWLAGSLARNDRGYILTGPWLVTAGKLPLAWPLHRRPRRYETSLPGVFAVGDVRAGSVKRVATAVGEGAIAVQVLHEHLSEVEVRSGP